MPEIWYDGQCRYPGCDVAAVLGCSPYLVCAEHHDQWADERDDQARAERDDPRRF